MCNEDKSANYNALLSTDKTSNTDVTNNNIGKNEFDDTQKSSNATSMITVDDNHQNSTVECSAQFVGKKANDDDKSSTTEESETLFANVFKHDDADQKRLVSAKCGQLTMQMLNYQMTIQALEQIHVFTTHITNGVKRQH